MTIAGDQTCIQDGKLEMNGRLLKVHGWLSFALRLRGVLNVNERVDLKHRGSAVQGRHRSMKNAWSSVCTSNFTHRNSDPMPTSKNINNICNLGGSEWRGNHWASHGNSHETDRSEGTQWPFWARYSAGSLGMRRTSSLLCLMETEANKRMCSLSRFSWST